MKPDQHTLVNEIKRLKREKNVTVLAHYYQLPEVQDLADYVGDSLGLAMKVRQRNDSNSILFAGVYFMAETAKIINPERKILIPDPEAGCSLAESCPPDLFRAFIQSYPGHKIVSYINCSAEIKAMSDVICTSSNAEQIIRSISSGDNIIFAPDKNLGQYLVKKTGRKMVLWDGECLVHKAFSIEKLLKLYQLHPEAKIIAHPEADNHVRQVAHFIGSTSDLIRFVKNDRSEKFIVATEAGILHAVAKEAPEKIVVAAPSYENNTCACSECGFMKKNSLEKIYACLLNECPVVEVETSLRNKALQPLLRMLEISNN